MAEWKDLGNKAKNLTLAGLGKARDLGESAKLNLDNVSEEENKKRAYAEIGKRFVAENPIPPEGYEELYRQLEQADAKISANKARINELKDDSPKQNQRPAQQIGCCAGLFHWAGMVLIFFLNADKEGFCAIMVQKLKRKR